MATSGLLCVNIKTRERSDDEGNGDKHKSQPHQQQETTEEINISSSPSARLLIQALIDNGIINASNKATIRIIDNSKQQQHQQTVDTGTTSVNVSVQRNNDTKTIIIPANKSDLSDFKSLNLGSFVIKQAKATASTTTSSSSAHQQHLEHQQQTSKQTQHQQKFTKEVFLDNSDAKRSQKIVVQNQNSGFIRICQQNQNQIVLDNASVVQNQGNLVFPIISGSNLIRLSDGSLVIPVHRVEQKKDSCEKPKRVLSDEKTDDDNSFASIVFQDRSSSIMDSEPPPLLILPTEESQQSKTTQNCDGEPIKLPENLESLPKAEHFPTQRHRWNTNEEIAAILISFERHADWQSKEVKIRPKSGSMLLYSRKKVRYRRDGYCWKKRKDGKTTREDHMKLKVQGTECIYGCYVHSAILPTFHRRCYWLLQNPDIVLMHYLNVPYPDDNKLAVITPSLALWGDKKEWTKEELNPDIVLVHYLNVPYPDDNKLAVITPSLALWGDKKEWTKEELVSQLRPMFYSEDEPDLNNELEISTAETVEAIVSQLMEKQRSARAAALNKQLECGCPDNACADSKNCSQPLRRISAQQSNNQVSSTTMLNHHHSSSRLMSVAQQQRVMSHHPHLSHHSAITSNAQVSNSHVVAQTSSSTTSSPLVLSLSQIQGSGGLLILNSGSASPAPPPAFVTTPSSAPRKDKAKQEAMEMEVVNSCHMLSTQQHRMNESTQHRSQQINQSRNSMDHSSSQPEKMDISNGNIMLPSSDYDRSYARRRESNSVKEQEHQKRLEQSNTDMLVDVKPFGMHHAETMSAKDSLASHQFFNETLDLSQEDIQQTLSANMPMTCGTPEPQHSFISNDCETSIYKSRQFHFTKFSGSDKNISWYEKPHQSRRDRSSHSKRQETESDVLVSGINPMEFIDVACSPPSAMDDDVFVNLDAFDMLGDFPELEVLDSNHSGNNIVELSDQDQDSSQEKASPAQPHTDLEYRETTANITDYSPEWAYPEGGVKVLVTGPWYSTTSPYTVLFDNFPVPTTLVQSGVLRCYCPAHEVGLATLQVACEGLVISNSAMFEYKTPPREQQTSSVKETSSNASNDNLLKFTLLQRLEAMDDRLEIKQEPDIGPDLVESNQLFKQKDLETRLVTVCQRLSRRMWRSGNDNTSVSWCPTHRSMTLLHLAASLGYTRLVCALLHWRSENSSLLLETEVDALSQDDDGFTPLMWACSRGYTQTALLLYQWNNTALAVTNLRHQSALEVARTNRHNSLADKLETVHRENSNISQPGSITEDGTREEIDLTSSTTKDEGIFLRPGAVPRNDAQKYKLLSLYVNIPNNNNNNLVPALTSSTPSPNTVNNNSNNNHQNVQNSYNQSHSHSHSQSLGTQTVTTRDNLMSGSEPVLKSGRQSPAHRPTKHRSHRDTKLSRFERSMSLPLSSPHSGTDSAYDSDIVHSPPRRMDFALCEVASGPRSQSPIIDVELLSDEDNHANTESVGEQEVRVLTLAEQIIAAMPDRIKNESEEMMLLLSNESVEVSMGSPLLMDEPPSSSSSCCFDTSSEFNFDHNYRYYDVSTPSSSLSPASSSCLPSPAPSTFPLPDSPSPPPTTADFCEFFHASASSLFFEKDFSNLTLSDREQRELYDAAKIIQKAYRSYKGRKKLEDQDKERAAAILIQNYYRRYKQYAYFKQMTRAAMVIQNGFRSYCEHKRFKKNQEAAVRIQNYYRNYRDQGRTGESTPPTGLKRTYSQRRQHQAARKIQQFMRQSKNKLQRERAEREKQADPCPRDAPPKSFFPDSSPFTEQNNRAARDKDSPG